MNASHIKLAVSCGWFTQHHCKYHLHPPPPPPQQDAYRPFSIPFKIKTEQGAPAVIDHTQAARNRCGTTDGDLGFRVIGEVHWWTYAHVIGLNNGLAIICLWMIVMITHSRGWWMALRFLYWSNCVRQHWLRAETGDVLSLWLFNWVASTTVLWCLLSPHLRVFLKTEQV